MSSTVVVRAGQPLKERPQRLYHLIVVLVLLLASISYQFICRTKRLGHQLGSNKRHKTGRKIFRHVTADVRTVLGQWL